MSDAVISEIVNRSKVSCDLNLRAVFNSYVYVKFKPLNSDSFITSDGKTFKVRSEQNG